MRTETKLVIDSLQQYGAFIGAIRALPRSERIPFLKRSIDLNDNTEMSQLQRDLLCTALSNIEWDIVVTDVVEPPEE